MADALTIMHAGGKTLDMLGIEHNSVLIALERPKVFSFTAWQHDRSLVPVRGS